MKDKVVVSLSGGLDSTILLYKMVKDFGKENVYALSFDYNQRHDIELSQAKETTKYLGVEHKIIDIGFLGDIVKDVSAMVKGDIPTPTMGDLEDQKKVITYVPFRNMILSAITFSYAESIGANKIALGVQYGDWKDAERGFYWDTQREFQKRIQAVSDLNDRIKIEYLTPFADMEKYELVKLGDILDVDFSMTHTCYQGKRPACGVCDSCIARKKAFQKAGIIDPIPYEQ